MFLNQITYEISILQATTRDKCVNPETKFPVWTMVYAPENYVPKMNNNIQTRSLCAMNNGKQTRNQVTMKKSKQTRNQVTMNDST